MGIPFSKIATKKDEDAGVVVVLDAIEKAHLEQEIQKNAPRVMKHMNDDHEESLVAYVLAFATGVEGHIENNQNSHKEAAVLQQVLDGKRSIRSAQLTNVDRMGYLLEISTIEMGDTESSSLCKVSNVRVPYDRPIHKAKELHHIAVRMHRAAYDKLGIWYKTKNGYYVQVVKIVAGVSYKSMKKNKKTTTAVVVVGAAAAAAAYLLVGGSHETKEIGNNKSGTTNLLSRSVTTAEMLKSRMTYWMGRE